MIDLKKSKNWKYFTKIVIRFEEQEEDFNDLHRQVLLEWSNHTIYNVAILFADPIRKHLKVLVHFPFEPPTSAFKFIDQPKTLDECFPEKIGNLHGFQLTTLSNVFFQPEESLNRRDYKYFCKKINANCILHTSTGNYNSMTQKDKYIDMRSDLGSIRSDP